MIKICFVCLGNICRSPMAEFIFKNLVKKENLANKFFITSKGTSNEEQGNYMHPKAIKELEKHQIPYTSHYATQITRDDYEKYDYFICMDTYNYHNLNRIFKNNKNKIHKLLEFSDIDKDIADPWYTGNFDLTYIEIEEGLKNFLKYLKKHEL